MYKSILALVDEGAGVEARIRLAAHLARESHACLIGAMVCRPDPLLALQAHGLELVSLGLADGDPTAARDRFQAMERIFNNEAGGLGLETSWRTATSFAATDIVEMAAVADLVVCGRGGFGRDQGMAVDELVMRAGRPVLVVPPGHEKVKSGDAIVAWKNTREARRAVADALPLLARAAQVTVLHIEEGSTDAASLELPLAFLDHHGIEATRACLPSAPAPTSSRIRAFAAERSASLIVLGAYGHNRIREWAFGGVTADLLRSCPIPCLFSH